VEGKGMIGVEALAEYLNIPVEKTTKTILFETITGEVIAAAVMGVYDINETKLRNIIGGVEFSLASPETVKRVTGAEVGYAGFINLPKDVRIILDESVRGRKNFEVGANHTNFHTINANFGRDFPEPKQFYDIALAKPGYEALEGRGKLIEKRGIEVGNIFQLGYHYSNLMKNAEFTDANGKQQKYYMGAYGIGIGRTMAALVEAHHDEKGIIWPENIAPFKVYLARLSDQHHTIEAADKLYDQLKAQDIEVLYDDRDLRAGQKFADADLLGIPYRLVVSDKTVQNNIYELKRRTEQESVMANAEEIIKTLAA
jgi:prolyl-tRNA synthetase